ncbi:PEP-utilizing enzyme [Euzebya tangerina]|uniref:PEP-utilizing enzyme n=1 Tax=Euzebya tangerina TaxID=591198 RepID=UPI000E30BEF0|nr:PEP-utilizing enzyme [Euzebya tangerina]
MTDKRFPSPFEIETPEGAEGWEELYPYSVLFSEGRREYEDSTFWFMDSMHWGWAMSPWDADHLMYAIASLSQYNSRHYLIPPANGIDFRILNGYPYFSPVTIDDGATIEARAPQFMERAGHYFANWDDLYESWLDKVKENIAALESIDFSPLPETEDMEVITSGRGVGSGWDLQAEYHRFQDLAQKIWQYHFEFLNLGYAAYLDFFGFCKEAFPSIPDLAVAKMVAGIEVDLFRPNEELKKLAQKAIDLGVADAFAKHDDVDAVHAALSGEAGQQWLAAWEEVAEPWFNFSSGTGFYYYDKTWMQDRSVPYSFVHDYITKLQAGEDISRPMEAIRAERDRIVEEYSEFLASDEDREAFQGKLGLARTVFPYVENHNFYIEHWSMSVFWKKSRELGSMLVKEGFFVEPDDIYFVRREEMDTLLFDLYTAWAVGANPAGPHHWPPIIAKRRKIVDALEASKQPNALGPPPAVVTEPFTIMLWGITEDSIDGWLSTDSDDGSVSGMAASPGTAEGPARIVQSADDIGQVQEGEILVAPITAPSWAPVFSKIKATVTDIGGLMSHAAIVCREYGVPAVTGTGDATTAIQTGDMIRVDGNTGKVTKI